MDFLTGSLGWKGERGYSAYEVAVKNGYVGTVQDWLASIGQSSHFNEDKTIYTTSETTSSVALPNTYTSNSFAEVYVNGQRLNANEYTIDTANSLITFTNSIATGNKIEVVILTMTTNSLPIVTTINSSSTNSTTPGTKAVYDFVTDEIDSLASSILNLSNFQVLTGNIRALASEESLTVDVSYPLNFTKSNTLIIGKMIYSNNSYYETSDLDMSDNGFPIIDMITLNDAGMKVNFKNTSSNSTRQSSYKIILLKLS